MSLLSLPDETLVAITSHIHATSDLFRLLTVCTRFYQIIEPQLYCSIDILGDERAAAVESALASRPQRARFVKSFTMSQHDAKFSDDDDDDDIVRCLAAILRQTCNLRSLDLTLRQWKPSTQEADDDADDDADDEADDEADGPLMSLYQHCERWFPLLEHVRLRDKNTQPHYLRPRRRHHISGPRKAGKVAFDVSSALALPGLGTALFQTLQIGSMRSIEEIGDYSTRLKRLDLVWCRHLSSEKLVQVLSKPMALESLSLTLHQRWPRCRSSHPFPDMDPFPALDKQRHALRYLTLSDLMDTSLDGDNFQGLRHYGRLETLRIVNADARGRVSTLMRSPRTCPPNLTTLIILTDVNYNHLSLEHILEDEASCCHWISEAVTNLPHLRFVRVDLVSVPLCASSLGPNVRALENKFFVPRGIIFKVFRRKSFEADDAESRLVYTPRPEEYEQARQNHPDGPETDVVW